MPGAANAYEMAKITPEMIDAAAVISGVSLTAEQKTMMLEGLTKQRDSVTGDSHHEDSEQRGSRVCVRPGARGDGAGDRAASDADERGSECCGVGFGGFRGLGICFGARTGGVGEDAEGDFRCVDEDVSGAVEKVRSTVTFCDHADGGTGSGECRSGG